jgi:hypothetical protein
LVIAKSRNPRGFALLTRASDTERLRLLDKQLAPAARADFTLNDFARVRRLEENAAVAALIVLRRTLIFGVRLTDLLAAAAAPRASAVPVNTTRREMRWQSFLLLFMIDSPSGLSARANPVLRSPLRVHRATK